MRICRQTVETTGMPVAFHTWGFSRFNSIPALGA
jgi:hypothetical protein